MGTPGPDPEVTLEATLTAITDRGRPGDPLTASELAGWLDCTRRTAHRKLEQLAERGEIETKKVGARSRVWWRPQPVEADGGQVGDARSTTQFEEFVRSVEDYAIFTLDPEGRVDSWNDGATKIKGYTEEEIVGEHLSTFYTEDDVAAGVPERNLELAREQGRCEDEGWRVRRDGSEFYANIVITAIYGEGELRGYTKVTRDLTQQRQARHERELNLAVSRSIAEASSLEEGLRAVLADVCAWTDWSIGIAWLPGEGTPPRLSAAHAVPESDIQLDGSTTTEPHAIDGLPGRVLESGDPVWLPDVAAASVDLAAHPVLPAGASMRAALGVPVLADGEVAAILEFYMTDRRERGDRLVEVVTSVAAELGGLIARRRAEEQAERERQLTEQLFQAVPAVLAVVEADGTIVRANSEFRDLLDVEGPARDLDIDTSEIHDVDGEPVPPAERPTRRVLETGEPVSGHVLRVAGPDGSHRWLSVNAVPITDADGDVQYVVVAANDVTELREHERELERRKGELEAELDDIFGRISEAFFAVDDDWRFTYVNEQARPILRGAEAEGLTDGSLEGNDLWEYLPTARDTPIREHYEAAMATQDSQRFEAYFPPLETWFEVRAYPSETGLSVYLRDVTDRIQRQRELERYERIFETVQDGVYTVDTGGRFTMVNEAYAEMTGRSREALIGAHVSEVVDQETIETARGYERELVEGDRQSAVVEADVRTADGGAIRAEATFALLPGADEEYQRVGVVRDVSERVARERELEQYETVFENVRDGVYITDEDRRFTMVNDAYCELTGLDRDEVIGAHISSVVGDDSAARTGEIIEEMVAGDREVEPIAGNHNAPDDRYLQSWFSLLPLEDGEFAGTTGVIRDITEREEREQELERALELLERTEDIADVGGWEIDVAGMEVFWTNHLFELLGRSDRREPPYEEALDVYHPDDRTVVGSAVEEAIAEHSSFDVEARYLREDGELRWFRVIGVPDVVDGEVVTLRGAVQDITERKEREQALERYKTVFDTVDDGIYILGPDFHFEEVNDAYVEMTGYDREELVGAHISGVVDEETSDETTELVRGMATAERGSSTIEADVVTKSGDRIPGESKFSPLPADDGFGGSVGVVRDLSDRKEYERELRRYETLIEESTDVNAIVDGTGEMEYVTPSSAYVLGYEPEELVGEDAFAFVHPDDTEAVESTFQELLEDRSVAQTSEFRFRHADGSWVWLEARGRNLVDDPTIDGLVIYTREVTDRKEYELELERRSRQQEAIAQLGRTALQSQDLDGLFTEATRRVAEVLDTDYCEVLDLDNREEELFLRQGVGWREGIVGSATVAADDESQAGYTLETREPVVVEDLDAEERFAGPELLTAHDVTSGISTIIGPPDEPWGILGTHDTDRRSFRAEDVNLVQTVANTLFEAIRRQSYQEELETLVDQLEESNERLEQFAHIASHDLQEPLRMVSGYLQLIDDRYADELDEDAEEFIEFAVDGADRMREMINGLLSYSRVGTRGEPLERTDPVDVIESARRNLAVQIEENDATVDVGELPAIAADRNQLEQVFQNLISNAIKYRDDEPPVVEIGCADRSETEVTISVADNGIGMTAEHTEQIFDVFERLHSQEEYSGTGIGLALCKKIVERHGGTIWVESSQGEGSTFYFTLPRAGHAPTSVGGSSA